MRVRSIPPPGEPRIVAVAEYKLRHQPASLRNYSRLVRRPTHIVLHCTDGCEGTTKDTDVATMFQDPHLAKKRSCGYVVDTDSATCCVADHHIAYHCGVQGNMRGIGIELCGRAAQTRAEWLDALSLPMLCIAARLVADKCLEWNIEPRICTASGLVSGERGITTHAWVSEAWKETNHYDPGLHFPLVSFVRAVAEAVELAGTPT